MVDHYIYILYHNQKPFYVGCSSNPTKRLEQHFTSGSPKLQNKLKSIKLISNIQIVIVEKVRTKSIRICQVCSNAEQWWIIKFIKEGYVLANHCVRTFKKINHSPNII